jgi:hypothetical protein
MINLKATIGEFLFIAQGEFKMNMRINTFLLCVLFLFIMLACNMPNVTISTQPDLELTVTAQALYIQQTSEALSQSQAQVQPQSQPAVASTETPNPVPVFTNTAEPSATPTEQKPQIINSSLCWVGPGDKYEVVSSVSKGQTVELLGRGSISGWFIIRNPLYHDPCWVRANDLQLDASLDLNSLQIFNPPPLPTNTPKPTLVPSPTPV